MNLTACILATGLFATFYATLGGLKAVIWCDVVQFFVLVGGSVLALWFILWDFGGDFLGIWRIAAEQGKTQMLSFETSLAAEYTVWSLIAFSLVVNLSSYGVDQVVVQRYFSARSFRDVLKSAVGQSLLVVPVTLLLFLVGIGLVAFYATHPAMMESLTAIAPDNQKEAFDRVLPHFITYGMPAGITGLIIAAIMAATMSSVDSGVNSLATVATMDYYRRFFHTPEKTDGHYLTAGRIATAAVGVFATTAALFVGTLGTIIEIIGKINGSLAGPLLALFLLAILTKRANGAGAFAGTSIGLGAVLLVGQTDVFWAWYAPVGLVVSLASGYALSRVWDLFTPKRNSNHRLEGLS
jgi:solute:Na+ symporter, SSS family